MSAFIKNFLATIKTGIALNIKIVITESVILYGLYSYVCKLSTLTSWFENRHFEVLTKPHSIYHSIIGYI